jgi:hypothetical protein
MQQLTPLSAATHAKSRWRRPDSFEFARSRSLVPLGASELGRAALAVPIVFVRRGTEVLPHALMGFQLERNLLVGPDGQWIGRYVPMMLRGYPFAMAKTESGDYVLCVEEDAPGVAESAKGELLFDENGQPSAALQPVITMFDAFKNDLQLARVATQVLEAERMIEPWPVTVSHEGGEAKLEGLLRVSEGALASTADDAFLRLRSNGALTLAYAQMFSQANLEFLASIGRVGIQMNAARAHSQQEIDLSWMNRTL